MRPLSSKTFNHTIQPTFNYSFYIPTDGLYILEITASLNSWWQNLKSFKSFFSDDDLTLTIDNNITFPKLNKKKGFFDGEFAWNGNNLKGLSKTNVILINLTKGNHILNFIANQNSTLESINIFQLENNNQITYISKTNNPAQKGDRRQWLNLALADLPLNTLTIKATAKKQKNEDDTDIKLIIDGQIQKNSTPKAHKDWYWCGKVLNGQEKEFNKTLNLSKGLHYIELWADGEAEVGEIMVKIDDTGTSSNKRQIQKYDLYYGTSGKEDYNRFDAEIIFAVDYWNNIFSNQDYPPPVMLDYDLVKAIIYIESRTGYFENSKGSHLSYPDIMQVGDEENPALSALRGITANEFITKNKSGHFSYNFPKDWLPVKVESVKESIFWGVRWLYHQAQKYYGTGENYQNSPYIREWKTWAQAVTDYNGSKRKHEYQKEVWQIYQNGIDPDGNILWEAKNGGHSLLKTISTIGLLTFLFLICSTLYLRVFLSVNYSAQAATFDESSNGKNSYGNFDSMTEANKYVSDLFARGLDDYNKIQSSYRGVFQNAADECQKNNCYAEDVVNRYYPKLVAGMKTNEQFLQAMSSFDYFNGIRDNGIKLKDIDNDGENEIIFIKSDVLNHEYLKIVVIDKINNSFQIKEYRVEDMAFGRLDIMDLTADARPEIVLFAENYRWGERLFVYQYLNNKQFKEVFKHDKTIHPVYTFSDVNNNKRLEIKIEGRQFDINPIGFECSACHHTNTKEVFEFDPVQNKFVLLEQKYFGVSGALYKILIEIEKQGTAHTLFANWLNKDKQDFEYLLTNLRKQGPGGLFSEAIDSSINDWLAAEEDDYADKKELWIQVKRPIRLEDLVERQGETKAEQEKRLAYFNNSPIYEISFKREKNNNWFVSKIEVVNI